jgi:RNA polymerase sigma-70 factor (ECF subfamily)
MRRSHEDIQDELLVLRWQGGELEALDALVFRWQPRLWRLAARLTSDRDAASDLVQEAWLAIVRGLGRLDDPARFRVWAYRIVANKCADRVRRRAVRRNAAQELQSLAAAREEDGGPSSLNGADEASRLRAALWRLPDDLRTTLALHYLEGLSVLEIAAVFNAPAGTVKSRLHNARAQLGKILQGGSHARPGQEDR